MTPEQKASEAVRLRAAQYGIKLMRNNVGVLVDKTGRPVRFGLANESKEMNQKMKSGDYIGSTPLLITKEMVGKTIGVFTSIEVKAEGFVDKPFFRPGTREHAQKTFIDFVRKQGGIAGFASDFESLDYILESHIRGYKL